MKLFDLNLESIVEDDWSLDYCLPETARWLKVLGFYGRNSTGHKMYIVYCNKCACDPELYRRGYFASTKSGLLSGNIPCGCAKSRQWESWQYKVLLKRKCLDLNFSIISVPSENIGSFSEVTLSCCKHGEFKTTFHKLFSKGRGCPYCGRDSHIKLTTKSIEYMTEKFMSTGAFSEGTKITRSERKDGLGKKTYFNVYCPDCNENVESSYKSLLDGCRSCACSPYRQKQLYINLILDNSTQLPVAIKFGISSDSERRLTQLNRKSSFEFVPLSVFIFNTVDSCKQAERDIIKEMKCGILSKNDIPSGYTETADVRDLEKIKEICIRRGGLEV